MSSTTNLSRTLSELVDQYADGRSVSEIADLAGTSASVIYRTLKTGAGLGWEPLNKVAEVLGVQGEDLVVLRYAWVRERSQARPEGAAFVAQMDKLSAKVSRENLVAFQEDVVTAYVQILKDRGVL